MSARRYGAEEWIAMAREAVAGHEVGTVEWARALMAWWKLHMSHARDDRVPGMSDPVDILNHGEAWCEQQAGVLRWLLDAAFGIYAETVQQYLGDGSGHVILAARFADGSWGTFDPDHGLAYSLPGGQLAHPDTLRGFPDYAAAERATWHKDGRKLWEFFSSGPRSLNFLIGDACNMHCTMCWQERRRATTERSRWWPEIKAEMVRGCVERYSASLDSVELISYGEPMLNPEFDEMARAILEVSTGRSRPLRLNVVTNGSLLHTRNHMQRVVSMPGDLTFSIDAPDRSNYEAIRIGGDFERVMTNLRGALVHVERHPDRHIGVNFTIFEANATLLYPMAALCASLSVSYLSVLLGALMENTDAAGQEIQPDDPRLLRQMRDVARDFSELRLNDYATARTLPALPTQTRAGRAFCGLPWRQMDVGPDGHVHPCCRSYYTDLGASGEDPWSGETLRTLREQILADDVDPVRFKDCAECGNLGAGVRGGGNKLRVVR